MKKKKRKLNWAEQFAKNFNVDPDTIEMEVRTPIQRYFLNGVPQARYTGIVKLVLKAKMKGYSNGSQDQNTSKRKGGPKKNKTRKRARS